MSIFQTNSITLVDPPGSLWTSEQDVLRSLYHSPQWCVLILETADEIRLASHDYVTVEHHLFTIPFIIPSHFSDKMFCQDILFRILVKEHVQDQDDLTTLEGCFSDYVGS